ncbi:pentapeptide repeat-containing protein [Streptomyces sp. NPDC094049]|uniref:pentapeptide repeat-containing protein n=1 Tax=Streptomyces sp. NPDC094049 TaxID=3154987 RepID=UPI00332E15E4
MSANDRAAYLESLTAGSGVDHRGTHFTAALLDELLGALRDPATGNPRIGVALFSRATFDGPAHFSGTNFTQEADFEKAKFNGDADFNRAIFTNGARFSNTKFNGLTGFQQAVLEVKADFTKAQFSHLANFVMAHFNGVALFEKAIYHGPVSFNGSTFGSTALFSKAHFQKNARFRARFKDNCVFQDASFGGGAFFENVTFDQVAYFHRATFRGIARFYRATFTGTESFSDATFTAGAEFHKASFSSRSGFIRSTFLADVTFIEAQFTRMAYMGPLSCGGEVRLDDATFEKPVTIEISARQVSCSRTRWASTATLRLRGAELAISYAVFEYPVLVTAHPTPFPIPEDPTHDLSGEVCLKSVEGVDAALLVLNDIDLSRCRFTGAVHLDQLKVDGRCTFAATPSGWSRRPPWKWSRRNTLLEEHHWRVRAARNTERAVSSGWAEPSDEEMALKSSAVAALYRQLRKSLEDGKNEPDAADFYYGECEMRRHDPTRPWGERMLLRLYWALSGYGLRATRALAWLGVSMTATVAVMMLWGLPVDDPKPATTGRQVAVGQDISLVTDTPKPVNPTGALVDRISTDRFEKSLRTVINSVVFRSSGQNLTTAGTYAEMISRLSEPVLLGLAVLAIRSRVKR